MFRNEVNRAISGALEQVSLLKVTVGKRDIQMSCDLKTVNHWLP